MNSASSSQLPGLPHALLFHGSLEAFEGETWRGGSCCQLPCILSCSRGYIWAFSRILKKLRYWISMLEDPTGWTHSRKKNISFAGNVYRVSIHGCVRKESIFATFHCPEIKAINVTSIPQQEHVHTTHTQHNTEKDMNIPRWKVKMSDLPNSHINLTQFQ